MTVATTTRCSRCGGAIIRDGWTYDASCLNCGRPLVAPRPPVLRRAPVRRTVKGGGYQTDMVRVCGHWLRALREERELSQAGLGELAGVAASAIGAWERGRTKRAFRPNVALVAEALGVDVGELLEERVSESK